MKYIVVRAEAGESEMELPFIFPDSIVHEDFYKNLIRTCDPNKGIILLDCISAGFISSFKLDANCHGHSETLKLASRGKVDNDLISMLDYTHGLI